MKICQRAMATATVLFLVGLMMAGVPGSNPQRVRSDELPASSAQEKTDPDRAEAELIKAFKDAELVFTGKISKVQPLGQTNSIPASIFGKVSFKDAKPLQGAAPSSWTFSYSHREGVTKNLDLKPDTPVVAAVKQKAVLVIVPATEANIALVNKTIAARQK